MPSGACKTDPSTRQIQQLLTPWAESVRRDLPWRNTRDPWAILVSEVMLQQTQVARVVPKWEAFLRRFPTPTSCAHADQSDVVLLWEGLGYHRRAVMLHRCALAIAEKHEGIVPVGLKELQALPGIGPYTARAIRVFAYETDDAVLDTNVGRIIARAVVGAPCSVADAQAQADSLVPVGQGWDWNQGMLDLGATVCTKRAPRCHDCPIATVCKWQTKIPNDPDPAIGSAAVTVPQSRFTGSDREGRGKILAHLRANPRLARTELPTITGWTDESRVARVVPGMITDSLIEPTLYRKAEVLILKR